MESYGHRQCQSVMRFECDRLQFSITAIYTACSSMHWWPCMEHTMRP